MKTPDTTKRQHTLERILRRAPVVAVVVIDDIAHALPMARALAAGGIPAIEVTLRTPAALPAIRAIASALPDVLVGAGTVLTSADLRAAEDAGARFIVSPGASPKLLDAADASDTPFLPGAATAGEAMSLLERGYSLQKFFPAVPAGGVELLRAWSAPLPQIRFCPTGGIRAPAVNSDGKDPAEATAFLRLPNVICVGGSWLTPKNLLVKEDWPAIEALARAASALSRG
jgi:2-dehydro-3-deoxyphosphogluconate aldolase / (4S)-4-hydroxy-2-oxoglutarate aldolase